MTTKETKRDGKFLVEDYYGDEIDALVKRRVKWCDHDVT